MDEDTKELLKLILEWWEDAQYWTNHPDFITKAIEMNRKKEGD